MKYRIYNIKYSNGRRGERSFIIESKKPISKTQMQESIFKKTNKMPITFNVDLLTLNEGFRDVWKAIKDTVHDFNAKVDKNADERLTRETVSKVSKFINELKEDIGKLQLADTSKIENELNGYIEILNKFNSNNK